MAETGIRADITGTVIEIVVSVGQRVKLRDALLFIESMKMEIPVTASIAGVVEHIHVKPGELVEQSQLLVSISV